MNDASQPLGPVLVFREKYQTIAAGLFPLLAKVKSQHAKRRGDRDRGTRRFSAYLGRAFPRHAAGADLLTFLHVAIANHRQNMSSQPAWRRSTKAAVYRGWQITKICDPRGAAPRAMFVYMNPEQRDKHGDG